MRELQKTQSHLSRNCRGIVAETVLGPQHLGYMPHSELYNVHGLLDNLPKMIFRKEEQTETTEEAPNSGSYLTAAERLHPQKEVEAQDVRPNCQEEMRTA